MKKEKNTYQSLKRSLSKVHWQRVESGGTSRGIPDVNGCFAGHEFWIELKILQGNRVSLTPQQIAWHTRRSSAGGVSWILVEDPRSKSIFLISGNQAINLSTNGLSSCEAKIFERPIDWEQLLLTLCLTERLID
jgi:Holliday junction resolvase